MFKNKNFEVTTAVNGHEALNLVQESITRHDYYDLVVLDLQMPISNGYETCKKINDLFTSNS